MDLEQLKVELKICAQRKCQSKILALYPEIVQRNTALGIADKDTENKSVVIDDMKDFINKCRDEYQEVKTAILALADLKILNTAAPLEREFGFDPVIIKALKSSNDIDAAMSEFVNDYLKVSDEYALAIAIYLQTVRV